MYPPTPTAICQTGFLAGTWIDDHVIYKGPYVPLDGEEEDIGFYNADGWKDGKEILEFDIGIHLHRFGQIFLDDHVWVNDEETPSMPELEDIFSLDEYEEQYIWEPGHDPDPGDDDSNSSATSSD
jgi:hypothetical protein